MKVRHNRNLDILRSFAAVVVVLFHLVAYGNTFDKKNSLSQLFVYNFPGHVCVLIFFILSGYVIGLNTPPLIDKKSIGSYLKKRLVRILPIYFVAVLFTALVSGGRYNVYEVMSNLLLLNVPLDNVMFEDAPLWSLNYEMLYYLVFIAFSYFSIDLVKTVKGLLIFVVLLFLFFHNRAIPPLLISYLIGFIFWITGAMMASYKRWPVWDIKTSRIMALLLLIFCLQYFNPYGPLLKVLKITTANYSAYSWYQQAISYPELYYFPLSVLLILAFSRFYFRGYRLFVYFLFISAAVRLAMIYKMYGYSFIVKEHLVIPSVVLAGSILLWVSNFQFGEKLRAALKRTASLSNLSYGLYIIHVPIICLFGMIVTTSYTSFLIKVFAYLATLTFSAYLLEEQYQPFVKKLLYKKKLPAPATVPAEPKSDK